MFAIDGTVVGELTIHAKQKAQSAQNAARQPGESEERYRALFDSIDEGFCVVEVRFDEAAKALDYRVLEVNRAFEKQTGISNAVGRWIREIVPATEEYWFQIFGQVALTGEPQRFENRAGALGRVYDVYAFRLGRPEQRQVAVLFNDITKRKQEEEALHRAQTLNQAVLGSLAANIAVLDREGNIVAVNDAWKRFACENEGSALADSVGVNYLQVCRDAAESRVNTDGALTALSGIQAVLGGTRQTFVHEYPCDSPSEKRWFLMSVTPLPGERGGAVVAHTDITERKRIEEELKAANVFLDAVIDNIPLMLFIKESQSLRFTRLNRAAEDLLGWPKQMLIGKNAYEFWPKEQADFFVEKDREALKHGSMVDISEERIRTRDQGVRILHTKKVPVLDPAGNAVYLLGISEDITERRRLEKEQQFLAEVSATLSTSLEYEQTLANLARLIVQNIADWAAVDVMDEQGRLSRLIVASADPDQAALCAVLEQLPPDRDLPHLMQSVVESKQPILVEHVTSQYVESIAQGPEHLEALLATGTTSFVAVPILMRGQPLGALVLTSSTESRVYRQRDLRLAEALADRAAVAIENARLYRASVHATQLRDHVLGVVAHDLRNPLSTILMQASAQTRQSPEPERRSQKSMEVIERAARRMDRLVQDLLDVALVEAGRLTIEPARLSAGALIVEAVAMQTLLAASGSIELRAEVPPGSPDVWGDRDRLFQVFENLIGNAIKFTQAGGRITVGAASKDGDVVFWVADTGSGIASEHLPRVFDRFWQATRPGRKSAGLGLAITRGIVEAHGGRIWVESTGGRGSTFSFTLPKAAAVPPSGG